MCLSVRVSVFNGGPRTAPLPPVWPSGATRLEGPAPSLLNIVPRRDSDPCWTFFQMTKLAKDLAERAGMRRPMAQRPASVPEMASL